MRPPDNAKGVAPKDHAPLTITAKRSAKERATSKHDDGKPLADRLTELSIFLRFQFLRHDALFRALGTEADKLAAQRLALFIDLIAEAQNKLLPPWLNGNDLLALARDPKKEARSCR